jgi:hypothetical protein
VPVLSFGQEQVRYRSDYFRQKSLADILKRERNKQNPAGKTKSEGRKEGKEVLDCEIGTSEPSDGCDARNPCGVAPHAGHT